MSRKKILGIGAILILGLVTILIFKKIERISDTKSLTPQEYEEKYTD
jgi:hypothetical protein